MSKQVLAGTRGGAAGAARAGKSGDPADGVGRVVGQAGGRRGLCRAHRRQPSGRRLGRQAGRRGDVVRRPASRRVAQITGAVDVPISVDIESGYGEPPQRLIDGLLSAGAVGLNIEDTVHKEGKRLRTAEEHAALVGELRKAADAAGVHVVINARTDLFLRQDGDEADRVDRAIARLKLAAEAGADSLYPGRPPRPGHVCAGSPPNCRCRSTRSRMPGSGRPGVVRPAWASAGSASVRSCSARCPSRAEEILAAGVSRVHRPFDWPGLACRPVSDDDERSGGHWHESRQGIVCGRVARPALVLLGLLGLRGDAGVARLRRTRRPSRRPSTSVATTLGAFDGRRPRRRRRSYLGAERADQRGGPHLRRPAPPAGAARLDDSGGGRRSRTDDVRPRSTTRTARRRLRRHRPGTSDFGGLTGRDSGDVSTP